MSCFKEELRVALYNTTGKLYDSPSTCHTHFVEMFKRLELGKAVALLDVAEKLVEWHEDNIKVYKTIISTRRK